jgi:hypothetical protein
MYDSTTKNVGEATLRRGFLSKKRGKRRGKDVRREFLDVTIKRPRTKDTRGAFADCSVQYKPSH